VKWKTRKVLRGHLYPKTLCPLVDGDTKSHIWKRTFPRISPRQVPVAHTCNPSHSRDRDQEDCSSKPAQANSSRDPISKISNTERAGGVAQGVDPEFKPWYRRKKKFTKQVVIIECPIFWALELRGKKDTQSSSLSGWLGGPSCN
jgi:hypothetical protein